MKQITLTNTDQLFALVDDSCLSATLTRAWRAEYSGYNIYVASGDYPSGTYTTLQNFIMGPPPEGYVWDHINRCGLDCTTQNLRLATHSQNNHNKGKTVRNTSGFKGVTFHKGARKWTWQLMVNRKVYNGKLYSTPEEAASVRRIKEIELLGTFTTNPPNV